MKKLILFYGPASSRSGYGCRAIDLLQALKDLDKYDVLIADVPWGGTPRNALQKGNELHDWIQQRIIKNNTLPKQPEIFIQLTVPNEFMRHGTELNIGITAGIETNKCSQAWIEGCNRMDVIFTSSTHSKQVFEQSTAMVNGVPMKVTRPVEVLFEGVNLDKYFEVNIAKKADILQTIPEDKLFLFVGHWLPGALGQDRKDVGMLIKTFFDTFKTSSVQKVTQPALVLKTTGGTYGPIDALNLRNKINDIKNLYASTVTLPNVYIIHGELTDSEMNMMYNSPKVIAHVSFTKGEGYGRPLAECSLSKKPLVVPNWSGLLDFTEFAIKLPGQLTQVHPSAAWPGVIEQDAAWFTVNYPYASTVLKRIYEHPAEYVDNAKRQAYLIRNKFSFDAMKILLGNLMEKYDVKKVLPINLPTLKKINLPSLPKLEKVNESTTK